LRPSRWLPGGPLNQHVEETNSLYEDEEKWGRWLDSLLETCNDPAILGLSDHFLYIGKKS